MMEMLKSFGAFLSGMFSKIFSGDFTGAIDMFKSATKGAFDEIQMSGDGVVAMYNNLEIAQAKAAENAYKYAGPIIQANKDEEASQRNKNSAYREGLQLYQETLTPMEKFIEKQMQINALLVQGAIDSTTASRAMQKAAMVVSNAYASAAAGIATDLGKVFEGNKAVAIATALINTYQAVTNAWANVPYPLNIAAAAAALAAGMTQVANIRKTTKGSSSGSSDSGGSSSSGSPGPTQSPQQLLVQGINPDQFYRGDAMRGLAEAMLDFQRNGGQVILQST